MFKKEKVLLASGCSYTNPNFRSHDTNLPFNKRGGWPMWPEVVANKLNLQHINTGMSGQCNSLIINKTIRALIDNEKNVDVVMILLSGWDRALFLNGSSLVTIHSIYNMIYDKKAVINTNFLGIDSAQDALIRYINNQRNFFTQLYKDSIKETLTGVYTLIQLCESRNIKYMFAQGVCNWNYESVDRICDDLPTKHIKIKPSDYLKYLASSGIGKELEKRSDHLIGWPFENRYGGFCIDDLRRQGAFLNKGKFKDTPHMISEIDAHPNAEEQKVIADIFYEKYMELYGLHDT